MIGFTICGAFIYLVIAIVFQAVGSYFIPDSEANFNYIFQVILLYLGSIFWPLTIIILTFYKLFMKLKSIITIALIIVAMSSFAQTKHKKHKPKQSDSTVFSSGLSLQGQTWFRYPEDKPDTISCYFKELVIKNDTITEKWQKGFIVYKWNEQWLQGTPVDNRVLNIFLYADKKRVSNDVIAYVKK